MEPTLTVTKHERAHPGRESSWEEAELKTILQRGVDLSGRQQEKKKKSSLEGPGKAQE